MWEFVHYIPAIFTPDNLLMIVSGTVLGLVFGATPGLNPTMAVVLLVPVTFHMNSTVGLILLGSVYSGAVAGGSIAAILINIPGAPPNVATVMDGYPMARKGDAQLALSLSFFASMLGGIFGCLILLLFAVPLAEFALSFGPAQLFWTAVVGITVMAGLSSHGIIRGLFSGCAGIMLSTVGLSSIHGTPRYVLFDSLMGGVNFGTAMVGLFAIPQIFSLVEELRRIQGNIISYTVKKGTFRRTLAELRNNPKTLFTSSLIGAVIGIIPGAGGQIAGIVSYEQARRSSRAPSLFGTGHPAGIIASECANNAMVGPSLIPTLTMGIPGSATAAVLMGGLLIHGLYPGPELFRNHADITYTFMLALLFAQVPMGLFGMLLARHSQFVLRISNQVMICGVLVLSVFGAYAIQNNMDDVFIMFGLGVAMYLAGKFGFSPAPLVLGLVLGGIVEENLLKGLLIARAGNMAVSYFFSGPINLCMIAACLVSIAWSVHGEIMKTRDTAAAPGHGDSMGLNITAGVMMLGITALFHCGLLAIDGEEGRLFPRFIIGVMAVLSLLFVAGTAFKKRTEVRVLRMPEMNVSQDIAVTFAGMVLYLYALTYLGFYTASLLCCVLLPALLVKSERRGNAFLRRAAWSTAFVAVLYILFSRFMVMQTPQGLLF